MKKGSVVGIILLLLAVMAGCGVLMFRTGGTATIEENVAAEAQQELYESLPVTPTLAPVWESEMVSAGFVLELIDRINASHQQDLAAVVHVSDNGMAAVKEVGEVGLVTGAAQGASPWCALAVAGLGVFTVVLVMSRNRGGKNE